MIKILIADDHHLVRSGIRALLEKLADTVVVGEAADGLTAVRLARQFEPDIIMMDIGMPYLNGYEATEQIISSGLSCKIIILSMHADKTIVRQALQKGANGYLLKSSLEDELSIAIQSALNGKTYLSPSVSDIILDDYLNHDDNLEEADRLNILTPRERQLLQLVAEGRTNRESGQIMSISERTVERHRANIMEKLDIHDIAGLIRIAIQFGLISVDN